MIATQFYKIINIKITLNVPKISADKSAKLYY